jgi:nicotinamide-nucleotide amidase
MIQVFSQKLNYKKLFNMPSLQVIACSKALAKNNWTIAFVESATAGKMSYEFSTVPDSGKILLGGLVCYNAVTKEDILQIPHGLIETFTPESSEVTKEMAISFCRFAPADVCVALTGLTSPGGSETKEKPVGTIFIYIIFPHKKASHRFLFKGSPEEIVNQAIDKTAAVILNEINNLDESNPTIETLSTKEKASTKTTIES